MFNTLIINIPNAYIKIGFSDGPVFMDLNETFFTGVEGKSLVIPFRVHANPNTITYTWTKDGSPLTHNFTGSIFNITRLSRKDSGIYSCEAINDVGSTAIKFNISVLCKETFYTT